MTPPSPTVPPITTRPPVIPTSVQLADKAADCVGVLVLGALAWHGTISGNVATIAICAILGVNTGLRSMGTRRGLPGLGALGLLLVALMGLTGREVRPRSTTPYPPAEVDHG